MSEQGGRRRKLSEEERIVWHEVTRSVKPLRLRPASVAPKAGPDEPAPAPEPKSRSALSASPARVPPAQPKPATLPAPAPLARRERQRLARGSTEIDARIDLHGLTQSEAHTMLGRFLRQAQANGAKVVLVITGKGSRGADGARDRGVLRRHVPVWLGLPEFRDLVVAFDAASAGHGGEGALYVRLRRRRA